MRNFIVIKTPCWPAQWKIVLNGYTGTDNSFSNFFRLKAEAKKEADRRNKVFSLEVS